MGAAPWSGPIARLALLSALVATPSPATLEAGTGAAAVPPPGAVSEAPSPGDLTPVARARWLMGAPCEIRAFGPEDRVGPALDRALDRIAELEQVMTTWRPDGELAGLNAGCEAAGPGTAALPVSPELARVLVVARRFAAQTGGAFDPTVEPLLAAWGVKTGGREPSPDDLRAALARTGWERFEVTLDPPAVSCGRTRAAFDLGAIGKGIALDEAEAVLRSAGVASALLNFGGQVLALAPPPGRDGWLVDVASPADRARGVRTLTLANASLSVTGNSERGIRAGGRHRGHVLDPRTGQPVERDAALVVIASTAAAADALSTALFVLGPGPQAEAVARTAAATFEFLNEETPHVP
ncbi:MAG: FAD:protein FMN transferase [Acidobacteria bacterium]|jgi:thiamine biosynthesis lipoprotein|nr:FAD:protein FMN transferase [Acidobacteriota bacterium]